MQNNECGPGIVIQELLICRVCGGVHGPADVTHNDQTQHVVQTCDCVVRLATKAPWLGYDFPKAVELCRCCGRAVLRSGSRWSVWFCSTCKPPIACVNQVCNYHLLPIGRHSIMAGTFATSPAQIPGFAAGLRSWISRVELLEEFAAAAVLDNLKLIEATTDAPDVSLVDYLAALPRSEDLITSAVRALGRRVGVPDELLEQALARD